MSSSALNPSQDIKSILTRFSHNGGLPEIVTTSELAADLGAPEIGDPKALPDRAQTTPFIFFRYLSSLEDEEFIRHVLCVAATHAPHGFIAVEPASDLRIGAIFMRAARSVGLALETNAVGPDILYRAFVAKDQRSQAFFDPRFLERRVGFDIPIITPEAMISKAIASLSSKQGFSFVRFNHCEPRVMGYRKFFGDRDLDATFRIQWGRTNITFEERIDLAQIMVRSLGAADVLGMPNFNSKLVTKLNILENSFPILCDDLNALSPGVQVCNVNAHLRLQNATLFELIRAAEEVVLISGRDVGERLAKATGNARICQISVPVEHKFGGDTRTTDHFPDRMRKILTEIETMAAPGKLFLIGAGILGKFYCAEVKRRGGVALDIGSRFDAWAGVQTRGSGFPAALGLDS